MFTQGKIPSSYPYYITLVIYIHTHTYISILTNINHRHYVAFIRKEIPDEGTPQWVLYNDEKVVKAVDVEEMKKFAYVYFFKRTS